MINISSLDSQLKDNLTFSFNDNIKYKFLFISRNFVVDTDFIT